MRPLAPTVALAGAILLASGGAAVAMSTAHAPSTVTLGSPAPNTFRGQVDSPKGRCVPDRTVKLFQRRLDGEIALISQGVSDDGGIWRIGLEGQLTGKFFVKVKHSQAGSLLCKSARSSALHISP